MWVEVNNRVNYPMKRKLIALVENDVIDMDNPVHKFCLSWLTIRVENFGLKILVQSWSNHPLPSKQINKIAGHDCAY